MTNDLRSSSQLDGTAAEERRAGTERSEERGIRLPTGSRNAKGGACSIQAESMVQKR